VPTDATEDEAVEAVIREYRQRPGVELEEPVIRVEVRRLGASRRRNAITSRELSPGEETHSLVLWFSGHAALNDVQSLRVSRFSPTASAFGHVQQRVQQRLSISGSPPLFVCI
jgi:hypothetical protein